MSNEKIKQLLSALQSELDTTELNDETRARLRTLEADIDDLLEPTSAADDPNAVLEKARELDAVFEANHPVAGRFMREIVDLLARIGL